MIKYYKYKTITPIYLSRSLGQKLLTMNIQNCALRHLQLNLGAKLDLLHIAFASV